MDVMEREVMSMKNINVHCNIPLLSLFDHRNGKDQKHSHVHLNTQMHDAIGHVGEIWHGHENDR
jgi:hypothetical protein